MQVKVLFAQYARCDQDRMHAITGCRVHKREMALIRLIDVFGEGPRYAQQNGLWTLDGISNVPTLDRLNIETNCLKSLRGVVPRNYPSSSLRDC